MAMVLAGPYDERIPENAEGWTTPARRRPNANRPPSFVTTDTGTFVIPIVVTAVDPASAHTRAEARRKSERRSLLFEAITTALGLRPRRYPQSSQSRLETAVANVRSDFRDRAGH